MLSNVNIRKYSFEEERRDLPFGHVGDTWSHRTIQKFQVAVSVEKEMGKRKRPNGITSMNYTHIGCNFSKTVGNTTLNTHLNK